MYVPWILINKKTLNLFTGAAALGIKLHGEKNLHLISTFEWETRKPRIQTFSTTQKMTNTKVFQMQSSYMSGKVVLQK